MATKRINIKVCGIIFKACFYGDWWQIKPLRTNDAVNIEDNGNGTWSVFFEKKRVDGEMEVVFPYDENGKQVFNPIKAIAHDDDGTTHEYPAELVKKASTMF